MKLRNKLLLVSLCLISFSVHPDSSVAHQANGILELVSHIDAFATSIYFHRDTLFIGSDNELAIYDLSNPFSPQLISEYGSFDNSIVDIEYYNGCLFLINGSDGFRVLDVRDLIQPKDIAHFPGTYYDSDINGNLLLLADRNYGIRIYDIRDCWAIERIGGLQLGDHTSSIFSTSNIAYVTVATPNPNVGGSSGVDLFAIDVSDPFEPVLGEVVHLVRTVLGMDVLEDNLYIANYAWGLTILDIKNPLNPIIDNNFGQYGVGELSVHSPYLYFLDYQSGSLNVWDIQSNNNGVEVARYQFPNGLTPIELDIVVAETLVFISNHDDGVYVFQHDSGDGVSPLLLEPTIAVESDDRLPSLLIEKEFTIENLSKTTYQSSLLFPNITSENIPAVQEHSAQTLVSNLRNADQADISSETVDAFERLVLQEKTINDVLDNYSILNNYYTDAAVDFAGISQGGFLLLKAYISPRETLADLATKTILDMGRLWAAEIPDSEWRNASLASLEAYAVFSPFDPGLDGVYSPTDLVSATESVYAFNLDSQLRKEIADDSITYFVETVSPSIEKGVISVENPELGWELLGDAAQAEFRTSNIITLSDGLTQETTSQYINYSRGIIVNEILKDLADIGSVSTSNYYAVVASLWTRVQQAAIDQFVMHDISENMECLAQAAAIAGELAFQPEPGTISCDQLINSEAISQYQIASLNYQVHIAPPSASLYRDHESYIENLDTFSDELATLKAHAEALDHDQVDKSLGNLSTVQEQLNVSSSELINNLLPANQNQASKDAIQTVEQVVELELNQLGLYLAIQWYLDEPESVDAVRYLLETINDTDASIDELKLNLEPEDPTEVQEQAEPALEPDDDSNFDAIFFVVCLAVMIVFLIIGVGLVVVFVFRRKIVA